MDKDSLRARALLARRSMTTAQRKLKSSLIAERLESTDIFQRAQTILFYYGQEDEVSTADLIGKYLKTKKLFLPRLTSGESFIAVPVGSLDELRPGIFGIKEPPMPEYESEGAVLFDLILVPGVAFDREGRRLGMGRGYYDRFLSGQKEAKRVGLAFNEQILDEVPKAQYDENVDLIITENEIIQP